ncbi:hypothetical protein STEG23_024030, partial [Scotinomys teguina]
LIQYAKIAYDDGIINHDKVRRWTSEEFLKELNVQIHIGERPWNNVDNEMEEGEATNSYLIYAKNRRCLKSNLVLNSPIATSLAFKFYLNFPRM